MILFFDTETTGLEWRSMVQFAYILADDNLEIIEKDSFLVKPRMEIGKGAMAIHGITNEMVNANGLEMADALERISVLANKADMLIGHNVEFDIETIVQDIDGKQVLRDRFWGDLNVKLRHKPRFCTSNESIALLRILRYSDKYGYYYKFPRLSELYQYLFGKDFENAHDAMADIQATYECYKEMLRIDYEKRIAELAAKEEKERKAECMKVSKQIRKAINNIVSKERWYRSEEKKQLVEELKKGSIRIKSEKYGEFMLYTETTIHTKFPSKEMCELLANTIEEDNDFPAVQEITVKGKKHFYKKWTKCKDYIFA